MIKDIKDINTPKKLIKLLTQTLEPTQAAVKICHNHGKISANSCICRLYSNPSKRLKILEETLRIIEEEEEEAHKKCKSIYILIETRDQPDGLTEKKQ